MTTDNQSDVAATKPEVWEDALILAFRDLQWIAKQEELCQLADEYRKRHGDSPKEKIEFCASIMETIRDSIEPPPLLAKLDGKAETASGDVITSLKGRFFLLEFKAEDAGVRTERTKSISQLLQMLDFEIAAGQTFKFLSRRGHHFVYPRFHLPDSNKNGFVPLHELTLMTCGYLDTVLPKGHVDQEGVADDGEAELGAKELMWNRKGMGLTVTEMAAYLWALSQIHEKGSQTHPMKIVVANSSGFFWPGGDLSDLLAIAQYFDNSLQQDVTQRPEFDEYRSDLRPLVDDLQRTLSSALGGTRNRIPGKKG